MLIFFSFETGRAVLGSRPAQRELDMKKRAGISKTDEIVFWIALVTGSLAFIFGLICVGTALL